LLRELAGRNGSCSSPAARSSRSARPGWTRAGGRDAGRGGRRGRVPFAGDDLGDVEAFDAVGTLAKEGLPTLLVCSASDEQSALIALSDVVVHGPEGVLGLLRQLTDDARAAQRG